MGDEMDAFRANLKLMEEEEIVDSSLLGDHDVPWDLCLLSHVLTMNPFNNEAFKSTMKQIWKKSTVVYRK